MECVKQDETTLLVYSTPKSLERSCLTYFGTDDKDNPIISPVTSTQCIILPILLKNFPPWRLTQ
jgi:hypothetical protein